MPDIPTYRPLFDYTGVYGGPASRDELIRALKEALAILENTVRDAQVTCSPMRIELTHPGTRREE